MHRGQLLTLRCRPARGNGLQRLSGRIDLPPAGDPITIMSPARNQPGPRTQISMGTRAHTTNSASTTPVKRSALGPPGRPPPG